MFAIGPSSWKVEAGILPVSPDRRQAQDSSTEACAALTFDLADFSFAFAALGGAFIALIAVTRLLT